MEHLSFYEKVRTLKFKVFRSVTFFLTLGKAIAAAMVY